MTYRRPDIVKRLRDLKDFYLKRPVAAVSSSMTDIGPLEAQTVVDYADEAADEIERLRAQVDELERLLRDRSLTTISEIERNAAVLAEREACANIADRCAELQLVRARAEGNDYAAERAIESERIAAAIRARGQM